MRLPTRLLVLKVIEKLLVTLSRSTQTPRPKLPLRRRLKFSDAVWKAACVFGHVEEKKQSSRPE